MNTRTVLLWNNNGEERIYFTVDLASIRVSRPNVNRVESLALGSSDGGVFFGGARGAGGVRESFFHQTAAPSGCGYRGSPAVSPVRSFSCAFFRSEGGRTSQPDALRSNAAVKSGGMINRAGRPFLVLCRTFPASRGRAICRSGLSHSSPAYRRRMRGTVFLLPGTAVRVATLQCQELCMTGLRSPHKRHALKIKAHRLCFCRAGAL